MTMTATMRSVRSLRGPQRDHWQWTNTLISRTLCIIHAGSTRGKVSRILLFGAAADSFPVLRHRQRQSFLGRTVSLVLGASIYSALIVAHLFRLERARHIQIILGGIPGACAGSSSSSSSGRRVFRCASVVGLPILSSFSLNLPSLYCTDIRLHVLVLCKRLDSQRIE